MTQIPSSSLADAAPGGVLLEEEEIGPPPMTPEALRQLAADELGAEFRIGAGLAVGRWGPRFDAEDLPRAERVVLSLLAPSAEDPAEETKGFLEALKGAALLDHPHLIPICAYGASAGLRWYAIPAHSDRTLAEHLATSGSLPLPTVKRIAQQIASALDQAHRRGMMHGALTADDVLIAPDGWVRVEGIGIAGAIDAREDDGLTRLAPPAQGSDQVGLAMIIRECLAGAPDAPLPAELPATLETALTRATRPRPSERYRDLLDLVAALDGPASTGRPLQPTLTIGERARPEGWNELLAKEFATALPRPQRHRSLTLRLLLILAIIGAGVLLGPWIGEDPGQPSTSAAVVKVLSPAPPATIVPHPALQPVAPTPPSSRPDRVIRTPAPQRRPAAVAHSTPRPTLPTAPLPAATLPPPAPGSLYLNATPWGEYSIDGKVMGNTPAIGVPISPGRHLIEVRRDGYVPIQVWVDVTPGAKVQLTGLTLRELTP